MVQFNNYRLDKLAEKVHEIEEEVRYLKIQFQILLNPFKKRDIEQQSLTKEVKYGNQDRLTQLPHDGRQTAKSDEKKRVNWIVDQINTKTDIGKQLCQSYWEHFEKRIIRVEQKGTNSDHYDMIIYHTDGSHYRCEEKGSKKYRKEMKEGNPWSKSVQRYNGIGNTFSIGRKYAELWYDLIVSDREVSHCYGIDIGLIPTKEEWLKKDAFVCGDPVTEWGKQLKKTHRERYPGNTSINGKMGVPYDYRDRVNPQFKHHFTENDKKLLIEEAQFKLDETMDQKDCWLETSGTIEGPFNWRWYSKIASPKIKDIEMTWHTGSDIYLLFHTEPDKYAFKSILRFGKGTGFSNIRIDFK